MPKIQIIPTEYHQCHHCHRTISDYAICSCEEISNNGYNQALEDLKNALIAGEQNEEFVYNIEKIVERLRK